MNAANPGLRSRCSLQPGLVQDGLSALGGGTDQRGAYRDRLSALGGGTDQRGAYRDRLSALGGGTNQRGAYRDRLSALGGEAHRCITIPPANPGLRSRCSLQPGLVQDGLSALGGGTDQRGAYRDRLSALGGGTDQRGAYRDRLSALGGGTDQRGAYRDRLSALGGEAHRCITIPPAKPGLRSRCSLQPGLVQDGISAFGGDLAVAALEAEGGGWYGTGFQPSRGDAH